MTQPPFPPEAWLPPGKRCAILFSIDDVHPSATRHGVDAGGDLGAGVLGWVEWLADHHPQLRTTLCVTPDWRARSPYPTRRLLARFAPLADRSFLAPRWPKGTMRLDRHPEFVAYVKALPRVEIVPHGLHHVQKGQPLPVEFARSSEAACLAALAEGEHIFRAAGLAPANGHSPPGWAATPALRRAMVRRGMAFVASARDVQTPIAREALTAMSGMVGQPLIFPGRTEEGLIHIPVNFQATSTLERAFAILELGGLLSVKAHAIRRLGSYEALDGLDEAYAAQLDCLFTACEQRFGDSIWWAGMGYLAARAETAEHRAAA